MIYFLILLFSIPCIFCKQDTCANIRPMDNFNLQEFFGDWYVIEALKHKISPKYSFKCIRLSYNLLDDNGNLKIKVNRTSRWVSSGRPASVSAVSSEIGTIKDANDFRIRFYMGSSAYRDFRYILVDTNYKNFALIYSCVDNEPLDHETAWILSREMSLDISIIEKLKERLKMNNVDITKFVKINQKSCF